MMKKRTLAALTAVAVSCSMTGCVGTPVVFNSDCPCVENGCVCTTGVAATEAVTETATEAVTEAATEANGDTALKTGLSVSVSLSDSTPADAENAGTAKYDVTVVAVSVDEAGVIESCLIDSIPASVSFDTAGAITSDLTAEILTKNELGENYGMKAYGGAAYEWNEQAAALADYAEGKTLDELKNGAIDESGMAKDADLASTATIYLGSYVAGIEAAVNNAQNHGAQKGDVLRMATISGVDSSVGADGETDGTAQMDTDVAVLTMNGDVITSCYIDSVQAKVSFNAEGAITSDLAAPVQTKNELGEAYGMKAYAGSAYEWNEQAAAFAQYVTGKTVAEMNGIAVNEKTAPTEADLASTVTIAVGGFQAVIEKAAATEAEVAEDTAAEAETEAATEITTEAAEAAAVKTGLSVSVNIADSTNADAENAGAAKYDITVAAVTVNDAGVIESCMIDSVPATVAFDQTGVITSDLAEAVQTKNELGEAYGMKAYGGATYEWNEQAAALAAYAEGKTIDELKNGAIDETGMAKDVDLASTATIYLGGYVSAIEAAVNNAQHLGAVSGDELRLAVISGIGDSVNAEGETDGTAQLNSDFTVLTMNGDVITSCYIDSVQAKVSFNAEGAITSDLAAPVQTKNELGEAYGMKAYAGSAYEWNEQAAAFAQYVTGKTAEEVKGIAVNEKTAPTEADLASTVTIAVGGFQAIIDKAAN